jgi:hypothetical protein
MRSLLAASALLLLSSSGALAICPTYPDDASTGYSTNATAHALCLQRELQQRTDQAAQQARIDAELGNIRIEMQRRQRLLMQQLQQPHFAPLI